MNRKVLVNELSLSKRHGIGSVIPAHPVTSATRRGENLSESKKDSRQAGMTQEIKRNRKPHAEFQEISMLKNNTNSRGGFTLLEIIVVMGIITLMAGIMIPMVYRLWESNEVDISRERMMDLKIAMVGDPNLVQNGVRTNFGYAGDYGQLPAEITNALFPYLPGGYNPNTYNKDAWGNKFIYTPAKDASDRYVSAVIESTGPDGIPGNGDDMNDATDPELQIYVKDVTPTNIVQGNIYFIFYNSQTTEWTPPVLYAKMSVQYISQSVSCCIQLPNSGTVPAQSSVPKSVYFDNANCSLPEHIPIGKIFFQAGLFSDAVCSAPLGTPTAPVAVFVHDRANAVTANMPTINYTH
jgi:general secretion pathway protein G